eukprot:scaffold105346_cov60-Phaeocystis_antarctica.AAC.2
MPGSKRAEQAEHSKNRSASPHHMTSAQPQQPCCVLHGAAATVDAAGEAHFFALALPGRPWRG